MVASQTMLEHALAYAAIGWRIFPVSKKKKPLTSNGFKDASIDEQKIRAWWTKHPDAGIGVATGQVSGVVVLDIDSHKVGAEKALNEILRLKGDFDRTVVAETGGGGTHFYFVHPGKDVRVPTAKELMGFVGVDVRGDGGYAVLPPSGHESGNFYKWEEGKSPFESRPGICPPFMYEKRQRDAAFKFTGPITEGQRNAELTNVAGLMRRLGMEYESINFILQEQNRNRCVPPLSEAEVETIAEHIVKYPPYPNRDGGETESAGLEHLLRFEHTDTGFGLMLSSALLGQIKFNHTSGKWYIWRDHYWQIDDTEEITIKAIDTTMMYRKATALITDEDQLESASKFATIIQSRNKLEAGLLIARAQPSVATKYSDWNLNSHKIAALNGVIDLRTGDMTPGDPMDFISAHMNTEYQPGAKCPLFMKFMEDVFNGDKEVIDFVHRAAGYSLTGDISEQCMFMLVGNGSNGKSTLLGILGDVAGQYAMSMPFTTFERSHQAGQQTNDLAALSNGKRMVFASEPNEGVTINESRIKSLTGGDKISARFLHQEFFEFDFTGKIWLSVNHPPRVLDDSDGFWRRVRRVDFPIKFVAADDYTGDVGQRVKDPDLREKLKAEYPGILNWLVEGAIAWYRRGIKIPESVQQATQDYRDDSDPLHAFFSELCILSPDQEVVADDLYKTYMTFCERRQMKHFEIMSSTKFHNRLGRQFTKDEVKGKRVYIGIGLNPNAPAMASAAIINIRRPGAAGSKSASN